jgi:hypothetical protein
MKTFELSMIAGVMFGILMVRISIMMKADVESIILSGVTGLSFIVVFLTALRRILIEVRDRKDQ